MGLLNEAQTARIKEVRRKLWTRPFTVEVSTPVDPEEAEGYYDSQFESVTIRTTLSGDWVWKHQMEREQSQAGVMQHADLILNTDILHSGALAADHTRLIVDGHLVSMTQMTPYPDTGELVLAARKVG